MWRAGENVLTALRELCGIRDARYADLSEENNKFDSIHGIRRYAAEICNTST